MIRDLNKKDIKVYVKLVIDEKLGYLKVFFKIAKKTIYKSIFSDVKIQHFKKIR